MSLLKNGMGESTHTHPTPQGKARAFVSLRSPPLVAQSTIENKKKGGFPQ